MVLRFFAHLEVQGTDLPSDLVVFDHEVSEYINHLWHEGEPIGWAGNLLSGLQRFFPACKRNLPTSWQYHHNWASTVMPVRAIPFSTLQIKGLAGLCMYIDRPDMCVLLLVGFVCCLRTGEMYTLTWEQITVLSTGLVVVSLENTNTNKRKRGFESVVFDDPVIRGLIVKFQAGRSGPVLQSRASSFRGFFFLLLNFFGLQQCGYHPYSVRRGGATWHFAKYGSMSKTCLHGRWSAEKIAKIYIEDAMAVLGEAKMTPTQWKWLKSFASKIPR